MGYKHVVHNTRGPGFDSTLQHFFYICRQLFSILKSSNFSFLTCYRDACGYIKKGWIVDDEINALKRAVSCVFVWLHNRQCGLKRQN